MGNKENNEVALKGNTALSIPAAELEVAKKLDSIVKWSIENSALAGFERTYSLAHTIGQLNAALTPEYMAPIMKLQNTKLGFKTDAKEGYPESVVKGCLIEATLNGLQVVGNQWNIIKGNMYITKEGYQYKLNCLDGLAYQMIPALPRMNATNPPTSAAVEMKIIWSVNEGPKKEIILPIPIKLDAYSTTDQVLGKATRKARAWLYATVTGQELPDGDAQEDAGAVGARPEKVDLSKVGVETEIISETKKKEGPKESVAEKEAEQTQDGPNYAGMKKQQPAAEPVEEKQPQRTTSIKASGLFDDKDKPGK